MKALIIVDMIHDFVDGKYGSEGAKNIVKKLARKIEEFRDNGDLVVYLKDTHTLNDPELKVWGEHAIKNTWGSNIIEELTPHNDDIVIEKNTYDGFLFTGLRDILKNKNVDEVFIAGVATDICVLHTAFGAFARGFKVNIFEDLCSGTSAEAHRWAIEYMKNIYGANIIKGDAR